MSGKYTKDGSTVATYYGVLAVYGDSFCKSRFVSGSRCLYGSERKRTFGDLQVSENLTLSIGKSDGGMDMKATAVYENNNLKLMLEDSGEHTLQLEAAFYQKQGELFVKEFQGEFSNANQIIKNFERLMSYAFEQGEWEKALLQFAKICKENKIVWFLTGSACDAVRGMDIRPHDLDIEIFS